MNTKYALVIAFILLSLARPISFTATSPSATQSPEPRARELGVPIDGTPGQLNAITDVAGVEVGFKDAHLR